MKTIQTQMDVPGSGVISVPVPRDMPPGKHNVLVVIDETPVRRALSPLNDFPVDSVGPWPSDLSLSRKDLYGDNGR